LLAISAAAYLVMLPGRRLFYAASLAVTFALGNLNTTGWQVDIMPDMWPLVDAGQATTRIVGRQSDGFFVGPQFLGRTPYVLFQLPLRTVVSVKPVNTLLTEADVPGTAKWVLTEGAYEAQFRYSSVVPLGPLTLYLREAKP
jgi:hypothetical protein